MSKTIWKYDLTPVTKIDVPINSTVLCVQTQKGTLKGENDITETELPMLWILVDPSEPKVKRTFRSYGTGHDVPNNPGNYIGTFQIENGKYVFHVFEEI